MKTHKLLFQFNIMRLSEWNHKILHFDTLWQNIICYGRLTFSLYKKQKFQMLPVPHRIIYTKLSLICIHYDLKGMSVFCMLGFPCMWEVSFMFSVSVIWQWNCMYWSDSIERSTIYAKTLQPLMAQRIWCLWLLKQRCYSKIPLCSFYFEVFEMHFS